MAYLNITRHLGRRLALIAASVSAISLVATPASADPIITPIISAILTATGLAGNLSVFGLFTISTTALVTGLVTTSAGRGLHIRSHQQ